MKAYDFAVLGVGEEEIAFRPKTDRAKQKTPKTIVFEDRASALDYMRAAEAEGYRFLNARNLDVTRALVKYGYFVKAQDGQITQAHKKQNWGPLDTDYEPGDSLGIEDGKEGIVLEILTGPQAEPYGVDVMFILEERVDLSEAAGHSSPPRVVASAPAGEWNLAVVSGLITGIVLTIAIGKMGPSGLLVVGLVYAFFIQNSNFRFNWKQKAVATTIALVIGSYGRQILELWAGLYR